MLLSIWQYFISNPIKFFVICGSITLFLYLLLRTIRFTYQYRQSKKLIFLRITMPREDSQKDREKDTDKDFREKVGVMAQIYRNLHQTNKLDILNNLRTSFFLNNIFSFELVSHQKVLDFYVATPPFYKNIIEKQITSYYPDAEVQEMEKYNHIPEGNNVKGFYSYTKNAPWFSIRTFKTLEEDPLNSLSNVFSGMEKDETAVMQILVRPRSNRWRKKAKKFGDAYFKGKNPGTFKLPVLGPIFNIFKGIFLGFEKMELEPAAGQGDGFVRMLQAQEEIAKAIGEKATQTGFDGLIRILTTAKTENRAQDLCNNIIAGLNVFKYNGSNAFNSRRIFFIDKINDKIFLHNFERRLMDTRFLGIGERISLFGEDELASLYHFPCSTYNKSPNIRWMDYKVLPPPTEVSKEGILLGHNVYRGRKTEIRFATKDRARHQYIIGQTGTGKSAFLSYLARQDIINGEGVCVIDPHGDLIDDLLTYVPKERAKDVILFDPSDVERPMSLNMLEAETSAEMDMASSQATEIFIKLFGDEIFGPRIQHYFRNACLTLMEDKEEGATIIDVPRIFTDDAFLKYKVAKTTNPVVKSFWEHEYANTGDRERQEMIPYFSSKFGPFITNSIMRNTIGQKKSSFNFREVMDSGKILLVKLSKGKIGDLNTQLLGLVMVARIQMAAMSRSDIPESERKNFFLYVDEFQNFATDSFSSILSEARKYKLSLIMAHQYINQLVVSKFGQSSTDIRDAVFGNVGTMCSFKVGAEDAEYLAKEYAPVLSEQDIIGIANYKLYMKLYINGVTSRPFSLSTIWDTSQQNHKTAKIVKEYARLKHGRKREFVEKEIVTRIGIDVDAPPVDTSKMPGQPNQSDPQGNPMAKIMQGGKNEEK
jgi:hypothetical protein